MEKLWQYLAVLLAACTFSVAAGAAEQGTADEAVAMVQKAAAFLKKHGKEKALAEFNNPKGQFVRNDLYIFAFLANGEGIQVANGANPRLAGKNVLDIKDADGKYLTRAILAVGMGKEGKGWLDYKWPNPATGTLKAKRTYIERVEDVILGCGIYR
ncbi:MAG: cache domain-containing protein [Pseudomonadota bacterium]